MPNKLSKLVKAKEVGKNPRADQVINSPESELGVLYSKAETLASNKMKKRYVESCLFCTEDLVEISQVLELPVEVLEIYREFFFDTRGWDRLSKVDHIDNIPDTREEEATMKLWALSSGLDFIKWRLGKATSVSPVEGLQAVFNMCVYKSKEGMYTASTSKTSMEAVKWAKMSTDIARLLKLWVLDSSAAKKDLEIALRTVVPEFLGIDSILDENG